MHIVCNIVYQSVQADKRADDNCCEWQVHFQYVVERKKESIGPVYQKNLRKIVIIFLHAFWVLKRTVSSR